MTRHANPGVVLPTDEYPDDDGGSDHPRSTAVLQQYRRTRLAALPGALSATLLFSFPVATHAADSRAAAATVDPVTPSYDLGEIVVTGDRSRVVEEVATVDVVTAAEIERSGARTVDEVLTRLPGLFIRRGAEGIPLVDIRGLRTRNVMLLLDGVPLNSTFDGVFDLATLSVENIAYVKLTRGASSMLYGPDGNGGVINIVTRTASTGADGSIHLEHGLSNSNHVRGNTSLRRGDLGLVVAGSLYDSDHFNLASDFQATSLENGHRRLNSDRNDQAVFASLTYNASDATHLGLNIDYRTGERGKPPVTEDSRQSDFAPKARFERVEGDAISVHAGLSHELSPSFTIRPTIYFNQASDLTDSFDDDTFATQEAAGSFREDATARSVGAALQLALRRNPRDLVSLAVDVRDERWDASGFSVAGGGRSGKPSRESIDDDHSVRVASLALEYELTPRGPLSAVLGAGYAAQTRTGVATDDSVSFLIGGRYELDPRYSLRGSVTRRLRFPTLSDLYGADRGNPALDAERTLSYEVGADHRNDSASLQLELALFRTAAEDFIQRTPGDILRNTQKSRFQGLELQGRHRIDPGVRLTWSYTYLDAKNLSSGADTSTIQNEPRHRVAANADHDLSHGLSLRGDVMYVADSFALSRTSPIRSRKLGDYTVVGVGVSQTLSSDRVRLFGRVANLLDKNYFDSIGFPAPGRTVFIGIELRARRK